MTCAHNGTANALCPRCSSSPSHRQAQQHHLDHAIRGHGPIGRSHVCMRYLTIASCWRIASKVAVVSQAGRLGAVIVQPYSGRLDFFNRDHRSDFVSLGIPVEKIWVQVRVPAQGKLPRFINFSFDQCAALCPDAPCKPISAAKF